MGGPPLGMPPNTQSLWILSQPHWRLVPTLPVRIHSAD